ncbi:uncharacterized protein [Triticum aestivum]|uniref:uncharacterized protein n=1 Tax=Triticum aestivum TaxID=4565 RepID=UPI001D01023B|nr:uncharacterized protein LOC123177761 [Triticum aestivum]
MTCALPAAPPSHRSILGSLTERPPDDHFSTSSATPLLSCTSTSEWLLRSTSTVSRRAVLRQEDSRRAGWSRCPMPSRVASTPPPSPLNSVFVGAAQFGICCRSPILLLRPLTGSDEKK